MSRVPLWKRLNAQSVSEEQDKCSLRVFRKYFLLQFIYLSLMDLPRILVSFEPHPFCFRKNRHSVVLTALWKMLICYANQRSSL